MGNAIIDYYFNMRISLFSMKKQYVFMQKIVYFRIRNNKETH